MSVYRYGQSLYDLSHFHPAQKPGDAPRTTLPLVVSVPKPASTEKRKHRRTSMSVDLYDCATERRRS